QRPPSQPAPHPFSPPLIPTTRRPPRLHFAPDREAGRDPRPRRRERLDLDLSRVTRVLSAALTQVPTPRTRVRQASLLVETEQAGEEKLLRSHLLKEDAHHPRCSTSPPSVACQGNLYNLFCWRKVRD
uniref:Uncharacterized protein n=1 Tax=Aegilops tauschii subsp. strangulata TaxID=200361 RepID=A0A453SVK5_AEGTS